MLLHLVYAITSCVCSYGCCRKYKNLKAHVENGKVEFESAWLFDLTTSCQPIIFPLDLAKVDVMAK
jgi:hypothetical protein